MSKDKEEKGIITEDFGTTERMLVIPQQEENRKFLLSVDRSTKELVRQKFLLFLEYDWQANTIATVFLETLINILRICVIGQSSDILNIISEDEDHEKYIDLVGLLKIVPTEWKNAKAEKTGSINCKFIPGHRIVDIISDDTPRELSTVEKQEIETYYLTGDEKFDAAWDKFDKMVRTSLANKYKIMLTFKYSALGIVDCFLQSLYRSMLMRLKTLDEDEFTVSTNVNDYFEIYAISNQNHDGSLGVKFTITPGMYAKKGIKDDFTTENDD